VRQRKPDGVAELDVRVGGRLVLKPLQLHQQHRRQVGEGVPVRHRADAPAPLAAALDGLGRKVRVKAVRELRVAADALSEKPHARGDARHEGQRRQHLAAPRPVTQRHVLGARTDGLRLNAHEEQLLDN
jgi:hypothetical protein